MIWKRTEMSFNRCGDGSIIMWVCYAAKSQNYDVAAIERGLKSQALNINRSLRFSLSDLRHPVHWLPWLTKHCFPAGCTDFR